ncbi:MAG TPA: XRE family transcriptional regulator, partial [Mycobacteriales bacterium]
MPNDRLREAMLKEGMTTEKLAEVLGVDPKTVERWITTGRSPYPRHRYRIGALLRESESYLWPEARTREQAARLSGSEIVQFYPRRAHSRADLWTRLFESAAERVDVLVYAGLFLPEQYPNLPKTLVRKAKAGAKIRLLFGDPDSAAVLERSHEEGIGDAIPVKIRNTLVHYRPCLDAPGVELRLHATTLY